MRRCILDMDGVVVNFNSGVCRLFGITDPYLDPANHGKYDMDVILGISKEEFFSPLDEDFWFGLEPTKECFELVKFLEEEFRTENICLLTSPVLTPGCVEGKLRWVRKHLPQFSRQVLVGACKHFAACPHAYLIDDYDVNVRKFSSWGGEAILAPRPWNSAHADSDKFMDVIADGITRSYFGVRNGYHF